MARDVPVRLTTTPWDMFSEFHEDLVPKTGILSSSTRCANDEAVFVLTYIAAVFMTLVDAEACNTTTVSLVVTVTDLVSLPNTSTVTITQSGSAQQEMSTFLSANATGTLTLTEVTSVTETGDIGVQTASVTSTVTNAGDSETPAPSGTRVSIPETLSLMFPTVTFGVPCDPNADCNANTGAPVPVSNMTSTYTMTVTKSARVDATPSNPSPSWGAPDVDASVPPFPNTTIETSFLFSIPPLSSDLTVPPSVTGSIFTLHNGTETIWAWTTVTLPSNGAIMATVEPVASVLSQASSLLGGASSVIATKTQSVTVTDITSVLSEASSVLSDALSIIATKTQSVTVTDVASILSAAPSHLSIASSEIATKTVSLTVTDVASVLSAAASHLSIASSEIATKTSHADAGNTSTVTVFTTISKTIGAAVEPTGIAVNVTFPTLETQTTQTEVLTVTSVVTPEYTSSTSTTTVFSTIPAIASGSDITFVFVSTVVTAGVSDVAAAPGPLTESNNSTTTVTSEVTTYVSGNSTVVATASLSTALPLFNGTLNGSASSLRVPPIFSLFSMLLNMKKSLVGAYVNAGNLVLSNDPTATLSTDGGEPVKRDDPLIPSLDPALLPFPELTSHPMSSVPAHPAVVSISVSVSTTTETCNATGTATIGHGSTTITLPTTVLDTSTVFSTLTTSLTGLVPVFNIPTSASTSASLPTLNTTSALPSSTHASPAFGIINNHTATTASMNVTTTHPTMTVTHTTSAVTATASSDVGRLEITVGLLILVAVGAWFVL
ncbi:hypothetical protein A1O7_06594 [Cladophialophora yegresii CBS 114405]|uniref:Uncharacterized protein n=1 Tax=Cladophialophora yegresii CBS 114405 TaxID=1182544 RepID=W9VTU2_9EURO|nr:uncharacterized protein A1O7_06594 [Cladophialophora yegresii CBS 114405]EXJ59162.1 hypothetical protein A1O7_06594 [Cladophialophora yegresii CBS 114405]